LRYQNTTGLDPTQLADLIERAELIAGPRPATIRPYHLDFPTSVIVVLTWLRHNVTHAYLAEKHDVSQPTISRLIHRLLPIVTEALVDLVEPPALPIDGSAVLIDGTLVPTWNWRKWKENYSGKRKRPGLGIQVACRLDGRLLDVSEPYSGSIHDAYAYKLAAYDDTFIAHTVVADSGYQGLHAKTPIKATKLRKLSKQDKDFNKQLSSVRAAVERCISHLKTWKVLATGWRGRINRLPTTIMAVMALEFYRNGTS
jgi:hypothetical protein